MGSYKTNQLSNPVYESMYCTSSNFKSRLLNAIRFTSEPIGFGPEVHLERPTSLQRELFAIGAVKGDGAASVNPVACSGVMKNLYFRSGWMDCCVSKPFSSGAASGLVLNRRNTLMKQNSPNFSGPAQRPLLIMFTTALAFAQSGDISGSTSNFTTLGTTILKIVVTLAGMGFVGLIIFGGLTLATNRPRGLAMIGGGIFGALLAGLAFALVNTLTGQSVSTGMLVLPLRTFFS